MSGYLVAVAELARSGTADGTAIALLNQLGLDMEYVEALPLTADEKRAIQALLARQSL